MVMVNSTSSMTVDESARLLADAVLLLARIDDTCKARDRVLIAKKFVFSNHVNEAFINLLKSGNIGRLETGFVLTILHQHLTEDLFAMLDYDVVRTIEKILLCQLPSGKVQATFSSVA